MKNYIESKMKHFSRIFPNPARLLEHMFAVLGNGVNLNNRGWLGWDEERGEAYLFGAPVPLTSIYPWTENEGLQPFRKLAGCRDVGFKESAQYFIDCVMATPDDVRGIKEWKDNIATVEDVLLNTPTIEDEFEIGDMDKFLQKIKESQVTDSHGGATENPTSSVRDVKFFVVQWSDCPRYVEEEVRQLWGNSGYGNDNYICKRELDEELFHEYPRIYFWLKHKGVADGEQVLIHWWW